MIGTVEDQIIEGFKRGSGSYGLTNIQFEVDLSGNINLRKSALRINIRFMRWGFTPDPPTEVPPLAGFDGISLDDWLEETTGMIDNEKEWLYANRKDIKRETINNMILCLKKINLNSIFARNVNIKEVSTFISKK